MPITEPLTDVNNPMDRFTLLIPRRLHLKTWEMAERSHRTRSQIIRLLIDRANVQDIVAFAQEDGPDDAPDAA